MKILKAFGFIAIIMAPLALASCMDEMNPSSGSPSDVGGVPIEFTISSEETKALIDVTDGKTASWEDGDMVGLFQYVQTNKSGDWVCNTVRNVPFKYVAESGKFVPANAETPVWDGTSEDAHRFFVYYPYAESVTGAVSGDPLNYTLASEQTYDVNKGDILKHGLSWERYYPTTYGQTLTFAALRHQYVMLCVNFVNTTGQELLLSKVTLSNDAKYIAGTSTLILNTVENGKAKEQGIVNKSQSITTQLTGGVLPKGGSLDVRFMIRPIDYTGSRFSIDAEGPAVTCPAITFDGGDARAVSRILKVTPLTAELKPFVGMHIGGGVLYKIDGDMGYVLHPESEQTQWVTGTDLTAIPDNLKYTQPSTKTGEACVAAMKEKSPDLSAYPAAKYCNDIAPEGTWYLPYESETYDILAAYNGVTDYTTIPQVVPSELDPAMIEARRMFDAQILSCSSTARKLNAQTDDKNGDCIWCSNYNSKGEVRYIRFGKRSGQTQSPTSKAWTRCIKKIDLATDESTTPETPQNAPSVGENDEYDVFLLIGQSNMAGRAEMIEGDDQVFDENVYVLNNEGVVVPATNPLNIYSSIRKDASVQKMNPGYGFSKTVAEETGRKILLVVNARGGTSIESWAKGVLSTEKFADASVSTTLSYYDEAIRRTRQALNYGTLKGILWHQGCSNSSDSRYMAKLTLLANNLRSDLGADVPFIAGQIGTWKDTATRERFNSNIANVSAYLPWSDYVSSEGTSPINGSDGNPDYTDPHFNRDSQILMGKRYAQKMLKMVYGVDYVVE